MTDLFLGAMGETRRECRPEHTGRDVTAQAFQQAFEIPGYSCEGVIGRGGMGTVYKALQLSHNRYVAVKVLAEVFRGNPEFIARFQREARALATLEHPNIVPLIDADEVDGVPFIVMRLIDGPTLRTLVRTGLLDPPTAIELLTGVARALDFAHDRGCVHKDVKPHNILVEHGQHAWLADFGLTKLAEGDERFTSSSQITGSFDYLAPELAAGGQPSPASDIYSLAVTTFQTLTGTLPFVAGNPAAVLAAHAGAPRPAASEVADVLPAEVDEPLLRGMAVDPRDRPPSAVAMLDPLRSVFGLPCIAPSPHDDCTIVSLIETERESIATAAPTRTGERRRRSVRRLRGRTVGLLLAAVTCVITAVVIFAIGGSRAHSPFTHSRLSTEYAGSSAHTWTDYKTAGGNPGPLLSPYKPVQISCRVKGFEVQDKNVWWYRIRSQPWNDRYYVSADAFYNNDRRSGSLLQTPFYDPEVPLCQ